MPITQKFSVVCDEVRQENNGKFIIIGMYTPDISVPQLPFVMPVLTFFSWLETDRPGQFAFRMKLEHLESGRTMAEGMGMVQFQKPGIGVAAIRLGGVQFSSPGAYTFSVQFDEQPDRMITHFSVILNLATVPQPGLPQRGN